MKRPTNEEILDLAQAQGLVEQPYGIMDEEYGWCWNYDATGILMFARALLSLAEAKE